MSDLVAQYVIADQTARERPAVLLHALEGAHAQLLMAGCVGEMEHKRIRRPDIGGGAWHYGVIGHTNG